MASMFVVMTPTASANHCTYTDVADAGLVGVHHCESSYEYGTCTEGQDGSTFDFKYIQVDTPDGSASVSTYNSCETSSWGYDYDSHSTATCAASDAASSSACATAAGFGYSYNGDGYRYCYMYVTYSTPAGQDYLFEEMDDTVCEAYLAL